MYEDPAKRERHVRYLGITAVILFLANLCVFMNKHVLPLIGEEPVDVCEQAHVTCLGLESGEIPAAYQIHITPEDVNTFHLFSDESKAFVFESNQGQGNRFHFEIHRAADQQQRTIHIHIPDASGDMEPWHGFDTDVLEAQWDRHRTELRLDLKSFDQR